MDALFASAWYWLVAGLALIGLEIAAPGVYLLWIGLGAVLVGLFVAAVPDASLPVQLVVLSLAMVGAIVLGARLQSRKNREQPSGINMGLSAHIGKTVVASTDFHDGMGRIAMNDSSYRARSSAALRQGDVAVITQVDGAVLIVDKPRSPAASNVHGT